MLKILAKAAVLILIVLSVYFIVHPQACSNMLAGRQTRQGAPSNDNELTHPMSEPQPSITDKSQQGILDRDELFNKPAEQEPTQPSTTTSAQPVQPSFSQEDIDYAVASRYVELEREYTRTKPLTQEASSELSYMVMDDFGMSPAEWQSFMARATASGLFEKARRDLPPDTNINTFARPEASPTK